MSTDHAPKAAARIPEAAISVRHVSKTFVDRKKLLPSWLKASKTKKFAAVKDVSFEVKLGETFGLLGPNGSGKSTIIRMMATLLIPDEGKISVLGNDVVTEAESVKTRINRVSVEASFFRALSAKENILYGAGLYGLSAQEAMGRLLPILEELNFPQEKLGEPMYTYSRGLQQKIAIARGLLTSPALLLLDEPTTGLDPKSKRDVQRFLTRMRKEREVTILLTSHDMEEVERLCDRIAIIDKGAIVAEGTAAELKRLIQKEEVYELRTSEPLRTLELLEAIPGVTQAYEEESAIRFVTGDIDATLQGVTRALKDAKISFRGMRPVVPTLEDVFIKLTGRVLEEEPEDAEEATA